MVKYRYLEEDELQYFEEEFKQFLILNEVYHEEWVKINQENQDKALELVGLFSNQILQRVYENIKYLELRTTNFCDVMFFDVDEVKLIRIEAKKPRSFDFSKLENIQNALLNHTSDLDFYKSSRKIQTNREIEIHYFIEKGAVPSTKEFWNAMEKLLNPF
jgi:hypothetical protein